MSTCNICFEDSETVSVLDHAGTIKGDISEHRACEGCRELLYSRNKQCPWCKSEFYLRTVVKIKKTLVKTIGESASYFRGLVILFVKLFNFTSYFKAILTSYNVS